MVDGGLLSSPTATSYTKDIYPILQRARTIRWVETTFGAHSWPDPVTNQPMVDAIFARLRPSGNMPVLNGVDSQLTSIQLAHMQRWHDGNYTNDWAGVPAPQTEITPDGAGPRRVGGMRRWCLLPRHRGGRPAGRRPSDPGSAVCCAVPAQPLQPTGQHQQSDGAAMAG
jgi:hypothetical protein